MFMEHDVGLVALTAPTHGPKTLAKSLECIASLLWSSSFLELLAVEFQEHTALGLT